MTNEELTRLLGDLEKKLEAVAVQAHKANNQARKAEALLNGVREEVARLKRKVISSTETQEFEISVPAKEPPRKK